MIKVSVYGEKVSNYIRLNKNPSIGEQFADFEMSDQNGDLLKLSPLKGKIVLLEFWASWCAPCREENPNLVKTYKKFKSKGFEILAVSLDQNKDKWLNAIKQDRLNWNHVTDLQGSENSAALTYGVSGIPDNFLIDANGVIIARNLRGEALNDKLKDLTKLQ